MDAPNRLWVVASIRHVSSIPSRRLGIGVVVARLELDEIELVRRVAVHLVRGEEDERRLRTVRARRLEQVQRPCRVDLEVVEGPSRGQVVRRLRGAVDDEARPHLRDELRHALPVADVERRGAGSAWCSDRRRSRFAVVSPSGPKKSRRMLLSMPWTDPALSSRVATISEPTRPLEPVTSAVRLVTTHARFVARALPSRTQRTRSPARRGARSPRGSSGAPEGRTGR